jgi:alkylation response protein AidB-like acyl-CoA dehydrogenase
MGRWLEQQDVAARNRRNNSMKHPAVASSDAQAPLQMSKEAMVNRAAAFVPTLRERAERCEKLRRIPDETRDDFVQAGIIRISQPLAYGGLGLDMDTVFEAALELGRGCGSSAWMGAFWPLHNWMAGMWPKAAQEEYWADSHDVLSSTAWDALTARTRQVDGGIRLSGRWDFSSGIDHAQWAMLFLPGPPVAMCLVPRKDFRVVDTWQVTGLCGSGSNDVVVEDALVPEHRVLSLEQAGRAETAGRELYGTPFYKVPLYTWLSYTIGAPIYGMAQGAVDCFQDLMAKRVEGITGVRAGDRPAHHLRLAEASAEVDAARLLMRRDVHDLIEWGEAGVEVPLVERLRIRRDITFGVKLCNQAVMRLFDAGGAHAIYLGAQLQRFVRDVNAASHSGAVTWDPTGEQYGRVVLGLPPTTFFY